MRADIDLILGNRDPAEISAAYAQYIGALDAALETIAASKAEAEKPKFNFVIAPHIPQGEARFVDARGAVVGCIQNIDQLKAAKAAARSESVADRALRDGSLIANARHAHWTRETFGDLLGVVCEIAAAFAKRDEPMVEVSHLIDAADEALDALIRPDEPGLDDDPRHTLMENEWQERAREDLA